MVEGAADEDAVTVFRPGRVFTAFLPLAAVICVVVLVLSDSPSGWERLMLGLCAVTAVLLFGYLVSYTIRRTSRTVEVRWVGLRHTFEAGRAGVSAQSAPTSLAGGSANMLTLRSRDGDSATVALLLFPARHRKDIEAAIRRSLS